MKLLNLRGLCIALLFTSIIVGLNWKSFTQMGRVLVGVFTLIICLGAACLGSLIASNRTGNRR